MSSSHPQSTGTRRPLRHAFRQTLRRGLGRRRAGGGCGGNRPAGLLPGAGQRGELRRLHGAARRRLHVQSGRAADAIFGGLCGHRQDGQPHLRHPVTRHAQQIGDAAGDLDQAAWHRRTAVVDAHQQAAAGLQIGEPRNAGQLQRGLAGGKRALVEHLAVAGEVWVAVGIDRSQPGFVEIIAVARIPPHAAGLIRIAQHVMRPRRRTGRGAAEQEGERGQHGGDAAERGHAVTRSPSRPTARA